jgi:hypothetical protein
MSTARQKRKPVFDPSALDDDLDDLWPARPGAAAAPQAAPEPITAAPASTPASERRSKAPAPAVPRPTREDAAAQARRRRRRPDQLTALPAINPDTLPP